jgi:hypothetical protein
MQLSMKALLIVGALAALSACDDDNDRSDGSVSPDGPLAIRCDGTPDGFCPCSASENGGRRYLFCPDTVTWEEARDNCVSFGFELAKIETEAEQDFVWGVAEETDGDYWIGLSDAETEGTFVWSDGSALGSFAPWASEQPDSGDDMVEEDCVELIQIEDGGWNDRDCETDYLDYICEGPA